MSDEQDFVEDDFDAIEGRPEFSLEDEGSEGGFRGGLVLGLVIAAILVGFMVWDGVEAETYFYTADQAVAQGPDLIGRTVRVKGTVEPGSVVGKDGELSRAFRIIENGKSLKVTYDKAMPDTFDVNMEVVVQGMVNDDMVIVADEVLVKCPSRYEGAPPTAMPKSGKQAAL